MNDTNTNNSSNLNNNHNNHTNTNKYDKRRRSRIEEEISRTTQHRIESVYVRPTGPGPGVRHCGRPHQPTTTTLSSSSLSLNSIYKMAIRGLLVVLLLIECANGRTEDGDDGLTKQLQQQQQQRHHRHHHHVQSYQENLEAEERNMQAEQRRLHRQHFATCPNCLREEEKLSVEYSRPAPAPKFFTVPEPEPDAADDSRKQQQEKEEKDARLEAIKHQILLKLGLKSKPNVTHSLPRQFILDTLFRVADNNNNNNIYDRAKFQDNNLHYSSTVQYTTTTFADNSEYKQLFKLLQQQQQQEQQEQSPPSNYSNSSYLNQLNSDSSFSITNNLSHSYYQQPEHLKQQPHNNPYNSTADHRANNNEGEEDAEYDDFFGRTREIISFAERGHRLNGQNLLEFSSTLMDNRTKNVELKVRVATLWVWVDYKRDLNKFNNNKNHGDPYKSKKQQQQHLNNNNINNNRKKKKRKRKNNGNYNNHIINNNYNSSKFQQDYNNYVTTPIRMSSAAAATSNQEKDNSLTLWVFRLVKPINSSILVDKDFDKLTEMSASKKINLNQLGWQKFDLTSTIRKWYLEEEGGGAGGGSGTDERLSLFIDCSGCGDRIQVHLFTNTNKHNFLTDSNPQKGSGGAGGADQQFDANHPFLVIFTDPNIMKRVRRRALDCSGALRGQCCKERFYVSFKELGWDDWIIAPQGYFANYCRGNCGGMHRTPDTFLTYYTHVIEEYRKSEKLNGMQPCCAPLKFSSMSLIYFGQDSKIIKRDLPKMVVDECGCP